MRVALDDRKEWKETFECLRWDPDQEIRRPKIEEVIDEQGSRQVVRKGIRRQWRPLMVSSACGCSGCVKEEMDVGETATRQMAASSVSSSSSSRGGLVRRQWPYSVSKRLARETVVLMLVVKLSRRVCSIATATLVSERFDDQIRWLSLS